MGVKMETRISVNMNGKEYIEYQKSRSLFGKPLSKGTKKALPYFILCGVGVLLIILLIEDLTYKEPPKGFITNWKEIAPNVVKQSWSDIGKVIAIFFAPFLIIMIGLAWLIHGFGFLIFKG